MTVNQAVYKAKKEQESEDLPDLKDKNVADATLKIQSAFRGFQTRKEIKQKTETKTMQSVVKQASSSQQQTATGFESKQQPKQETGPLITASNVIKAFTSSSTITKTTMRASRVVTGHVPK